MFVHAMLEGHVLFSTNSDSKSDLIATILESMILGVTLFHTTTWGLLGRRSD